MEIEIEAEVVHGRKLGRRMGFPTANMQTDDIEGVSRGVYRSSVEIDGHTYTAMSNLGVRPSVGGESLLLETHVRYATNAGSARSTNCNASCRPTTCR